MKIRTFLFFIFSIISVTSQAIVTPVKGCSAAYNHLLKNPYEENFKSRAKKKVVEEVEEDFKNHVYSKEISQEDFDKLLESVAISLSRLSKFDQGYEKVMIDEVKNEVHRILNLYLDFGWEALHPLEIEVLKFNQEKLKPFLLRLDYEQI